MNSSLRIRALTILACVAAMCGCASQPTSQPAAATTVDATSPNGSAQTKAPPGQTRHKWTKASEAEVAKTLDEKFQEAAKAFVKLKRDDQVMFCKNYKDIGSNVRRLHCITEAELRKQVEDSDQLRDQMRQRMGRCDLSGGCGGGQDPKSNYPLPQQ